MYCRLDDAGQARYLRISTFALPEHRRKVRRLIVLDDVTNTERQRQALERADRLDALGQLTGGIAHDFNNLLASVQYALLLTKNDECSPAQAKYIDTALKSVKSGTGLTNRLLAFAKQQPGLAKSRAVATVMEEF